MSIISSLPHVCPLSDDAFGQCAGPLHLGCLTDTTGGGDNDDDDDDDDDDGASSAAALGLGALTLMAVAERLLC